MKKSYKTFISSILILLYIVDISSATNCTSARTCSECISVDKSCKWCSGPQLKPEQRCRSAHKGCPETIDPPFSKIEVVDNRPFSDDVIHTVQLKPQRIEMESRVGGEMSFDISYRQATDYPMDLYYLMDLSCTMIHHKQSVSRIGKRIAETIQSITKDFRIGFGSFVDKETIPFSNYHQGQGVQCQNKPLKPTYAFKNHLPLTTNSSAFEERVESADISGNLDSPEGTLDALMQVMVCDKEIGWRQQSDKMIVIATDAGFHIAGDGRLGGAFLPNDGLCHTRNGRYLDSALYDYPSMQHIGEVANKKKFNLVFTVNPKAVHQAEYNVLKSHIGDNAHVTQLSQTNTDAIVSLIDEVYQNISTSVQLVVEYKPDNVQVQIWSDCGSGELHQTSVCRFQGKAEVPFQIRVKLLHCSMPGVSKDQHIRIGLLNKNETIEINLKEVCKCDCELHGESDSQKCSRNGTFSCGICSSCNGIRSGEFCECDPEKPIDPRQPDAHCRKKGDSRPCSGNGQCVCARCVCDSFWAGDYCEQDESSCYNNGIKCNGQGDCVNNQCQCNDQFGGKWCDCPKSKSTCISDRETGQICSDRGECECGQCKCKQATAHGRLCEKCPMCHANEFCDQILSCVPDFQQRFCMTEVPFNDTFSLALTLPKEAGKNKDVNDSSIPTSPCVIDNEMCPSILERWNYVVTDDFANAIKDEDTDQVNHFRFPCMRMFNGCSIAFQYRMTYDVNHWEPFGLLTEKETVPEATLKSYQGIRIAIQQAELNCPKPVNMVLVGSSAFLSVLVIGLLTIVAWKIITEYLDKKEYERFMKEVDCANFTQSENPLYKDVHTRVRNPVMALRDRTSRFFFPNR